MSLGQVRVIETHLTCRFDGCPDLGVAVIVTIGEGFCFERCSTHALETTLWPPRLGEGQTAKLSGNED